MKNGNELVVGLDVGSNSLGWAVVEMNGEKLEKIHGMGSRIIPMGAELKDFEQGNAITKNAVRRQKRSMRRNNQRYKLRRANLVKVLQELQAMPEGLGELAVRGERMLTSMELYELRAKAVSEPISLLELGRVLYHMNQRRGYKDIGELMDEMQGVEKKDEQDRKVTREVEEVVVQEVALEDDKGKVEIYSVTLGDGRTGTTRSRSFLDLVGKKEYIEVKTRTTLKGETIEFYRTSVTDWKKDKDNLDRMIEESGLHPGQFFYKEFQKDPLNRIRERIVLRERFRAEFDAIWAEQAKAHPVLRDPAMRDRIVHALVPNNKKIQDQWLTRDLGTIVRDHVIYYQRPLKSQVSNKGMCRFEPRKPVVPVSSPVYQLFRIWQQVNNIRLVDRYMREEELTAQERNIVVQHLIKHTELKSEGLMKVIGRGKEEKENNLRANLPGHQTLVKLRPVLKKEDLWKQLEEEALQFKEVENTMLFKIWHILYSVPEAENRRKALTRMLGVPDEVVAKLAAVRFERKHGAVSSRAAARILPLMMCGEAVSIEDIHPRDQQRIQAIIDQGEVKGLSEEMKAKLTDLTSLEQFQGLPYWKAATVIYGDHRAVAAKPFDSPDEVKSLQRGFLRNPVVEQVVNETLMVMRDIWKVHGRPTSIRVELARELRQNQQQRSRTHSRNQARDKERSAVRQVLINECNRPKPSRKDIEKYELWKQQKHQCIYSGKPIEVTQLFDTREVDIDHIIPQSKFYDDSIQNRVLCFRTENAGANGKNKMLAAPYMKAKGPAEWEAYVKRVNSWGFGWGKRKYLMAEEVPESFINRQLQETRYIGTEVRKHLERFATTNATLGIVTDVLKNEWGLNKVYKEVLLPRFERLERIVGRKLIEELPGRNGHQDWRIEGFSKRIDHRHHALDALVVALTRQKFIQRLSNMNQVQLSEEEMEAMKRPTWYPLPHPDLRKMVRKQLERTIPSIKNRQRLLTRSTNETQFLKNAETGALGRKRQSKGDVFAVRGALHDEQPMGEVREQRRWPLRNVLKWLYEQPDPEIVLQPLEKKDQAYTKRFIAHEHERALLAAHFAKYDWDVAKFKNGLKKDPVVNGKNEEVNEITVLETKFAAVRTLSPMFTLPMVEKIIDRSVRKRVSEHLKAFGNDPKKAFAGDGLHILNDGQAQKLNKVRCIAFDTSIQDTKGFTPLHHKDDPNTKQYVKKGDNHALVIWVNEETGEREFDVIAFYDAVERQLKGIGLVDVRPGWRHFILRKNDMVYVPRPDEDVRTIDWNAKEKLGERVMRMTQMSGNRSYFLQTSISQVVDFSKQEQEFGSQHAAEFEDRDSPRTKINSVCIPMKIDRLGQPVPLPF